MLAAYICAEGRRSAVSRYLHLQNTTHRRRHNLWADFFISAMRMLRVTPRAVAS